MANKGDIYKVALPNGDEYNFKDKYVRENYRALNNNDFDTINVTELNSGNIINTGAARFLNTINGSVSGTSSNVTGTVAIANGGTGATTRLGAAQNLTNEAVSNPGYVVGLTTNWGKFGYTTIAQLKTAIGYDTTVTSGSSNLITSGAVAQAIDNLPEPMVFKGTLGTNGTITSLPTASASNEGYTYKVITAGTYASQAAKVGDVFVCAELTSGSYSWVLIPAGDTDSDSWRNIKINGTEKLTNVISSGAVDFINGTNTTVSFNATGNKIQVDAVDTKYGISNSGSSVVLTAGGTGTSVSLDTLLSNLPTWTANPTDDTYFIRRDTSGSAAFGQLKFSTVWNYIKGKADSVYAPISHNQSANTITAGYLNIQPENSPILIPFINNDLAFMITRGGSTIVKYDDVVQSIDISGCFDGGPGYGYAISNSDEYTTIVMELTLHQKFGWTNTIYVDFGAASWRAKDVEIEVINTAYSEDVWTSKYHTTTNAVGHCYVVTSHTPVGASNAGGGFNKIRFTFKSFNNKQFRIAQLGVYNYGSTGTRTTYMSRGIDDAVWRSITPATNNTYNLGSSSYKWAAAYATTFYGNLSGNATSADSATTATTARKLRDASVRPATANTITYDGVLRYFLATSSMSTGKPMADGSILSMEWDNNGGYAKQLYLGHQGSTATRMQVRSQNAGTWGSWLPVGVFTQTTPTTGRIIITDGTDGGIKASDYTIATSVPANAVFTDTNYYHKTGTWSGLTYTAAKVGSPDDLVFTIPTGTTATTVALGNHNHDGTYLKLSGGTMTGVLKTAGADINLGTAGASSDDSADLVWLYGNGSEKMRFYAPNTPTVKFAPFCREFKSDGTSLYNGHLVLGDGTGASGTWEINISGSAGKLTTNAGSATNPIYFSGGVPVACTYNLNKTVPSDAVFTDTTYTIGTSGNNITLTPSGGSAQNITVPYATSADKIDGYHMYYDRYVTYYDINQPTANEVWYVLVKTNDWNSNLEVMQIRTSGNNKTGSHVLYTGSRGSKWWGYAQVYSHRGLSGVRKYTGNADCVYLRFDADCTKVRIYTSFTAQAVNIVTDVTDGYTEVPTYGGWYGNQITVDNIQGKGCTMTGQIKTSFKEAIAMGSRVSDATTIEALVTDVRYSSGCCGSVNIGSTYTKNGITIPTGWYNYEWIPHRSGGVNGEASGDNCNYGKLYLSHMTSPSYGTYEISFASSSISQVRMISSFTAAPSDTQVVIADGVRGGVKTSGYTIATSVPENAVFTDTNYYHTTGSWSGLTYTATANGGAGALAFTIPTGTSATTVAVGNHNHNGTYVKVAGDSMTGTLCMNSSGNNYGEGIRINAGANNYSTLTIGTEANSTSGISDKAFWIGTNRENANYARKLYIAHNTSTNSLTYFYATSSTDYSPSLQVGGIIAGRGVVAANTANSSTAGGLALYGTSPTDYGIAFRGTGNGGKHGYVQGDWAQYHYMAGADTRGWVFNAGASTGVASISRAGHMVLNGSLTVGGNATNTSGVRQIYNSTTQSLDFVFVA